MGERKPMAPAQGSSGIWCRPPLPHAWALASHSKPILSHHCLSGKRAGCRSWSTYKRKVAGTTPAPSWCTSFWILLSLLQHEAAGARGVGGGHMLGSFLISMAAQRDGPEVTQASDTLLPVSLMQELPYCPMPILARHSLVCCPLSLPKGAQHEQAEATAPCPRWPYSPVSAGLLPHKMPPPHPRSPVPLRVPLPTHTHMSHLVPGRGSSLSPATSIFGPSPV